MLKFGSEREATGFGGSSWKGGGIEGRFMGEPELVSVLMGRSQEKRKDY